MKRSIYLIQPTYRDPNGHPLKGQRVGMHSLVLPALSATIPPEWKKSFCFEYFEDVDYSTDASLVGISSMGYDIAHGIEIAAEFRKLGKTVIMGGPQATLSKDFVRPHCDAIVVGNPGRSEMEQILADGEAGTLQSEYSCGTDINFQFDYPLLQPKRIQFMPLLSSVGCKNNCDFCCNAALHNGHYQLRHPDHILSEMKIVQQQSRIACFVDSNFYNNHDFVLRLCNRIISERIRLRWGAQCSVDIGEDPEVLAALYRSGCRILFLGFETLHQKNLADSGKQYRVDSYRAIIRSIKKAGIAVAGYFVLGFDHDTVQTFDQLFNFIRDTRINLPILNILLPAPGTRIASRLRREGRLTINSDTDFLVNHQAYAASSNRCLYTPAQMSSRDVEEEYRRLALRLSSIKEILRRSLSFNLVTAASLFAMNRDFARENKAMRY